MKVNVSSTKLKGTVLFTVVSVLMVLIVILLGTLALAATASNRAYQNYQKEQTEYTARALLDSVVTAINNDNTETGIKSKVFGLSGEGASLDVTVQRSDNLNADNKMIEETVKITQMKSRFKYYDSIDPDTGEPYGWKECRVYNLEAINSKTMADTTYSVLLIDEPINTTDDGDKGASFVSLGSAVVPDGGIITGGTAAGLDAPDDTSMNFKIQNTYKIETNSYFRGNLEINNKGSFYFLRKGNHVAVTGNLSYGNDLLWEFCPAFAWDDKSPIPYEDIPCVYVGGVFQNSQQVKWDTKNRKHDNAQPVNLYCGSLKLEGLESLSMSGDIYAFDEDATNVITSVKRSQLFDWTSKNISFSGADKEKEYSFGSFYTAGSARFQVNDNHAAMEIGGDCRVAKNLECAKNVIVHGDLVVGDTLTIGSNARLKVHGKIYAANLANYGEIDCDKEIIVFNVLSQGINKTGEITPYDTAGMSGVKVTKWIENMVLEPVSANPPYSYNYSYTEYTKEGMEVKEKNVAANVQIAEVNGVMGPYWFQGTPECTTVQQAVEQYDSNYMKLMQMKATEGQQTVEDVFDISTVYKQPIYPEGFDKATIRENILKVQDNYDPKRFNDVEKGYPQSLDAFEEKFGFNADVLPEYKSYNDLKTKTGDAVITQSCIIHGNGSWSNPSNGDAQNLYIKADGKQVNVIIRGNVTINNGASLIINESNGGRVNFFIDKDGQLNLLTVASMLTTDIIKQFEGDAYGTPGFSNVSKYNDTYFSTGNFSRPGGQAFGFNSMKSEWNLKKSGDPIFPDVYLFAGENAKMKISDGASALSVNIRAPLLEFTYLSSGQTLKKPINYIESDATGNATRVYSPADDVNYIAMVGQLIAGQIHVENYFGLMYVTEDPNGNNGDGNSTLPDHYTTIQYEYY